MKTVIIDYHKGNIRSVERGLAAHGADVVVSDDVRRIADAGALVLPGVGAFADAMGTLNELGISSVVKERVAAGVPFLGICLGLHLLFEGGSEHVAGGDPTPGLGILPGVVDALPKLDAGGQTYKIPHVGWNSVSQVSSSPLFAGIAPDEHFYFTHSYCAPASAFGYISLGGAMRERLRRTISSREELFGGCPLVEELFRACRISILMWTNVRTMAILTNKRTKVKPY